MSKTTKSINKYLGYKFFKEQEDGSFDIIRVISISEFNDDIKIMKENGDCKKVKFESIKGYTPLEPYGLATFTIVKVGERKDTIVSLYKHLDIKLGNYEPYALCRQSVTDFFYNLISQKIDHDLVGVSVSRDNCPTNVPYHMIAACDDVILSEGVNLYLDDNVESLLKCVKLKRYDAVLAELYKEHCIATGNISNTLRNKHHGWCKDLQTLLNDNNFIVDLNMMDNVTSVDFPIEEVLVDGDNCKSLNNDALQFLRDSFKVNAVKTIVIEYGYDIDLADFNNSNYVLLRDSLYKLYIISYVVDGEYIERDLETEAIKQDVTTKLRLSFFNKYKDEKQL